MLKINSLKNTATTKAVNASSFSRNDLLFELCDVAPHESRGMKHGATYGRVRVCVRVCV